MADDTRAYLKDLITNVTREDTEKAKEAFHSYLLQKMQKIVRPEDNSEDDPDNSQE